MDVRLEGIDKLLNGLNAVSRNLYDDTEKVLDKAAKATREEMKAQALKGSKYTHKATGALQDSISIESSRLRRSIGSNLDYAYYQERGKIGGQRTPPISKIYAWARAKGITNRNARGDPVFLAAKTIARKIATIGYAANPMVLRTFNWVQSRLSALFGPLGENVIIRYQKGR